MNTLANLNRVNIMNAINFFQNSSVATNVLPEYKQLMLLTGKFVCEWSDGKMVSKLPSILELKFVEDTEENREFIKLTIENMELINTLKSKIEKAKTEKSKLKYIQGLKDATDMRLKAFKEFPGIVYLDTKFSLYTKGFSSFSVEEKNEFFLNSIKTLLLKSLILVPTNLRQEYTKHISSSVLEMFNNSNNELSYSDVRDFIIGMMGNLRDSLSSAKMKTFKKYAYFTNNLETGNKYANTKNNIVNNNKI